MRARRRDRTGFSAVRICIVHAKFKFENEISNSISFQIEIFVARFSRYAFYFARPHTPIVSSSDTATQRASAVRVPRTPTRSPQCLTARAPRPSTSMRHGPRHHAPATTAPPATPPPSSLRALRGMRSLQGVCLSAWRGPAFRLRARRRPPWPWQSCARCRRRCGRGS